MCLLGAHGFHGSCHIWVGDRGEWANNIHHIAIGIAGIGIDNGRHVVGREHHVKLVLG